MASLFISWSGKESRKIAEALRDWIPLVTGSLEPWVSSIDLQSGQRWSLELAKKLEKSNFGIIVITPHNKLSPWLIFESGALSKSITEGRVIPYLLGLETHELDGPLSQFQANCADRQGTFDLIKSINSFLDQPTEDKIIHRKFEALWPEFNIIVEEVVQHSKKQIIHNQEFQLASKDSDISELQEELIRVKEMVKQIVIQSTIDDSFSSQVQSNLNDKSTSSLEGAFIDEEDNSHLYIRVINGKIVAPYCYEDNDKIDAEYYDWNKIGEYWLARYRWFHSDIQGFALYKLEANKLVGNWWSDDAKETKLSNLNSSNLNDIDGGTHTVWTKQKSLNLPRWATSFFKKHE